MFGGPQRGLAENAIWVGPRRVIRTGGPTGVFNAVIG
jgi:hypothetical protein